ncbi:serine hydrolase domain-containing protein [Rhodococcus sp. IEGM 1370]|uniref:serine hydrolase domain-containing protein n=1 Tax=Rhodococcus sp. IEGM 1370 TaxID=3082222 RepID=UPI002954E4EC|nr:serine hydrolase domain-containing protein [Rhodococcus sp. IEGM 1370]MDV8079566.1 serine hydrolase domain-containing protein [Rhodococcus sp. IEGM 1370]
MSTTPASLDQAALDRLRRSITNDIEAGNYDGAVIAVARHGEIGLHEAIGFADRSSGRTSSLDDVFWIFSMTKAFTNILVLQAIDRGQLDLTTRVVDVIPEFVGRDPFRAAKKDRVNIGHLLTHRAGLVVTPTPLPYSELGNLEATIDAICQLDVVGEPGGTFNYSPTLNHALLGEVVRRVSGYSSYSELLTKELFEPLKMHSTALGAPKAWTDRMVPIKAYFPPGGWLKSSDIEIMQDIVVEGTEMPWVGAVSTAGDVLRFAEMIRRGGELDGVRILSPGILDLATTLQTGTAPNDLYAMLCQARGWDVPPGNFGLGFALRGEGVYPTFFGAAASPRTHGNYGAGSTLFWVDPERNLTFVCLTAGVMEEGDNLARFQRLSTMATATAL